MKFSSPITIVSFCACVAACTAGDSASRDDAIVLKGELGYSMVYNKTGMFVGALNDSANIHEIIDKFGKEVIVSSDSNCLDYSYISWIKNPVSDSYQCGGFTVKIKERAGPRSYSADMSCLPVERDCSKIEFDGVAFRIEVLDGKLVSLTGYRAGGDSYVFKLQ